MSSDRSMRTPLVLAVATMTSLWLQAIAAPTAAAQAPPSLATIRSLSCSFPVSVSVTWKGSEPQPEVKRSAMLTFKIDEIDAQDGSALFIASAPGMKPDEHLVAQLSGSSLHFLDIRPDGELNITTVFAKVSGARKLRAVYTQTAYVQFALPDNLAEPDVTQRYGECEIRS
jgi:hypothetical protein